MSKPQPLPLDQFCQQVQTLINDYESLFKHINDVIIPLLMVAAERLDELDEHAEENGLNYLAKLLYHAIDLIDVGESQLWSHIQIMQTLEEMNIPHAA